MTDQVATVAQAKPTSVADTLRAARALIEDPKRWTKGAPAKKSKYDNDYFSVTVDSPEAGAWCAVGAILRVDGPYEDDALVALATAIEGTGSTWVYGPNSARREIESFNDTRMRRHKEVMQKFDKAIALVEGRNP